MFDGSVVDVDICAIGNNENNKVAVHPINVCHFTFINCSSAKKFTFFFSLHPK